MTSTCWNTPTQTLKVTRIGSHVSGESDGTARSRRWWLSHLRGDSLDESSDHAAEQNHWSERGRATSVAKCGRPGPPASPVPAVRKESGSSLSFCQSKSCFNSSGQSFGNLT